MSVTPRTLFELSQQLFNAAQTEEQYRNVIGRAYYAAYHGCEEFHHALSSHGHSPPQAVGAHAELIHRLLNPTIPASDSRYRTSFVAGQKLKRLRALRVRADYRLEVAVQRTDALDAIIKAAEILRELGI